MSISREEIRQICEQVKADHIAFPRAVKEQQLRDAGWVSDPSGEIWLPPKGTIPYRPYQLYSGWKRMREIGGIT
jgi:hypothetical protein